MKNLFDLIKPSRLTSIVDVGANPIDGDPPCKEMLAAGYCRVIGFEPQAAALLALLRKKDRTKFICLTRLVMVGAINCMFVRLRE